MVRVVSIGAWCRPAHQIKLWAESAPDFERMSGPFDWAITSYGALRRILMVETPTEEVLSDPVYSYAGSGMCPASGLIFHHDLDPRVLGSDSSVFAIGAPIKTSNAIDKRVESARSRFRHAMGSLEAARRSKAPIIFVRWRNTGHPHKVFPEAFEDENDADLSELIENYLQHNNFFLVAVQSEILPLMRNPIEEPVLMVTAGSNWVFYKIRERLGWNGDQTNNFRGDELSWSAALADARTRAFEQLTIEV